MYNLKIEPPCDDSYDDDEQSFLSYYTFLENVQDPVKVSIILLPIILFTPPYR